MSDEKILSFKQHTEQIEKRDNSNRNIIYGLIALNAFTLLMWLICIVVMTHYYFTTDYEYITDSIDTYNTNTNTNTITLPDGGVD